MTKFKNFLGNLGYSGLLIILACGLTIFKYWALDNDTWFILNCGRYVVETVTIPHTEFASIHEGLHYVMEQWLAAILFWKIYSNFGADGLIFFSWAVGFILMFVYFKLCLYVSGGNEKVSALLSLAIAKPVTSAFIVTRPQILSTLILLLEIFLLEKFVREKKVWTLCILPVLAAIFINIHAALFPMLIVLMLPFIAESLYQKLKPSQTFEFEIPLKPLIFTAVGIVLASFINPYGAEAITFLFTSYDPEVYQTISEVKPPSAASTLGVILFAFSALTIFAFTKKNLPLRYFFLTFGIMILAFYALRNIFLFMVLATFPLAYAGKDWHPFENIFNLRYKLFVPLFIICLIEFFGIYKLAQDSIWELHLPIKIIFGALMFFLICFTFFYRREGKLFSEEIFILRRKPLIAFSIFQVMIIVSHSYFISPAPNYEPYKPAVDFLLSKNRAEDIVLWTGFNSGAYFEFRGIKCYLDPRPEIYALSNNHKKDIIKEYLALGNGNLDYREFLARYNFTHIFVSKVDMLLYMMLSNDKNYRVAFEYDFEQFGQKSHGKIFVPVSK